MSADSDPMPMRGDAWQAELEDSKRSLVALKMRVDIDHEPRRMGCKCGAQFGDSIDARCHLINQTIEAVIAAGWVSPERIAELADSFEDSIDWSDGRSNYGDNEAYAACARDLRAIVKEEA